MAISKKSFVNLDLQGNSLVNPTIGLNSDMTKAGSFQYNSVDNRLEYFNGSTIETVANLGDVTGALDFQGGYDAATNTPDLTNPVSGAIKKGYYWVVTAAGTFFGEPLAIGDSLFAQVDNPASLGDWVIVQGNLDLATDTVAGISRLATQAEVDAGTEGGAVVVTPATLQGKIDAQITPEINNKLPLTGGSMLGAIDMNGNDITMNGGTINASSINLDGAFTFTSPNDITGVNDIYANGVFSDELGSKSAGDILLVNNLDAQNSQNIVNLPTPTNGGDAANKTYVDNAAATAESNANAYTDTAIAQEVTDRNAAIAAQSYTTTIATGDWTYNAGIGVYEATVTHNLGYYPLVNTFFDGYPADFYGSVGTNDYTIWSNTVPTEGVVISLVKANGNGGI